MKCVEQTKILAVITTEYGINGVTSVARNIYNHIDHNRIRIDFAVKNMPSLDLREEITEHGGRIILLPDRKKKLASYLPALIKLLKKESYDGIHVHGNSATMAFDLLAARLAGIPVRIAHGHNSSCDYQRTNKLLKPLFYRLYTHALTCSEEAGKWLYGDRSYLVFHNAVSLKRYQYDPQKAADKRRELGIAPQELVIGHVGAFSQVKNQQFLVECAAYLAGQGNDSRQQNKELSENLSLLLVGSGELVESVREKAENAGVMGKVRFLGNRSDVPELMQAMDVFALPSLFEGLPLVLVEAQAAGLPCIVSDGVTQQADLCGDMRFVPLSQGAEVFGAAIKEAFKDAARADKLTEPGMDKPSRETISRANCERLADLGYDINQEVKRIELIYQGGEG